ncbi:restriction endonuclease [Agromyces sp. GXQ0307]|uniref:restriction endonuclease n=1 Tax=Agromyces sp. GXQ0307 TaxID=3377835 RepID=UPI003839DCE5
MTLKRCRKPSERKPTPSAPTQYEMDVADLLARADPGATVEWNAHVVGRASGRCRQIDALIEGSFATIEMAIAIECKKHGRKVTIGVVDEFIGKVIDSGADRGVLYSWEGADAGAIARAKGAYSPTIEIRELKTALKPWPEVVDEWISDCPNPNCPDDISWREREGPGGQSYEIGTCYSCGTPAVKCGNCGQISDFPSGETICQGCGAVFSKTEFPNGGVLLEVDYSTAQ